MEITTVNVQDTDSMPQKVWVVFRRTADKHLASISIHYPRSEKDAIDKAIARIKEDSIVQLEDGDFITIEKNYQIVDNEVNEK